jgi:hypothetical protein
MIRNDILECFIIGYALEIPNNDRGRPTSMTPLWLAAREKCGECSMDELLDTLYTLGRDNVDLSKIVPLPGGLYQAVSFERAGNTPKWKDFFMVGHFNIKVLPGGRLRFQRLREQLQKELPPSSPPPPNQIGFTS